MTPEVFIATVPWRVENLHVLLHSLDAQTLPPERITVIFDNYARETQPEFSLQTPVERVDTGGHLGAGYRWRYIDEHVSSNKNALAIMLDDDMAVERDYIEKCVRTFDRLGAPYSWNGMTFIDQYISPERVLGSDIRLFVLGAGTMVLPAHLIRGISLDPSAPTLFGVLGDDEALVSWMFAKQGLRLFRPRGASSVMSTKFQSDPRSQWGMKGGRHFNFRKMLKERGWPLVDPPAEYRRATRFRGVATKLLPHPLTPGQNGPVGNRRRFQP